MNFDAWIVGSAADPGKESPKDIDVMIPWSRWHEAVAVAPEVVHKNSMGGWKFLDEGVWVDMWPDSLERLAGTKFFSIAYHPRSGVRIVKVE